MRRLQQAKRVWEERGILNLLCQGSRYLRSDLRRFRRGGLSSRSYLEPVAGIAHPVLNTIFENRYGSGVDIMDEDWDTLVLLDACRYDDFAEINSLSGELEHRISQAPDSRGFVLSNFYSHDLHDTVYVTANPHVSLLDDGAFHSVIDSPISNWDSDSKCVRPEHVTKSAIDAHDRFPNKRIIVHYMQPHDPPLGQTAREIQRDIHLGGPNPDGDNDGTRLMPAVAAGQISVETARKAYRETLQIVLEDVRDLVSAINGKIVVSADHGEMFGEQPYPVLGRLYEHYHQPKTVELCKVPWLVINNGNRRTVESEPPISELAVSEREIEDQLTALGYK